MFNTGHALLLVGTRFLPPPICRRFTGGNAGERSADIRRAASQNLGDYPSVVPLKLPGNCPAIAGRLFNGILPFVRSIDRIFPPQYQRLSAVIAGAITGHVPISSQSYA